MQVVLSANVFVFINVAKFIMSFVDITEQIVNEVRSHQTVDKEYLDTLDQVNVSKGFAKKFQKWVNQQENKGKT